MKSIVNGDSAGRKIEIELTGDDVLVQEMRDLIVKAMLQSRMVGVYRSVCSRTMAETAGEGE